MRLYTRRFAQDVEKANSGKRDDGVTVIIGRFTESRRAGESRNRRMMMRPRSRAEFPKTARAVFKELRVAALEALMSGRVRAAIRVVPRSELFAPEACMCLGGFFIAVRGGIPEDAEGEISR